MPAPPLALDQVVAFDLAPIGQGKTIGRLPLHHQGPLMGITHMLHELRVTKPTVSHAHRRWQCHGAPPKGSQALIEHHPRPCQFVSARRSRSYRIRPSNGKIDWHDQAAIPHDHQQQEPINARQHPFVLAAPPPANQL